MSDVIFGFVLFSETSNIVTSPPPSDIKHNMINFRGVSDSMTGFSAFLNGQCNLHRGQISAEKYHNTYHLIMIRYIYHTI